MKVVLRRLEAMGELSIATDRLLDTDCITLGRGTDQHVQLPDMHLSLAHCEIRSLKEGEYTIESKTRAGVWVNGVPAQSHRINAGDVIDCGRFRLTVGVPPPDVDLLLEIIERISAREEKVQRKDQYRLRLADTGLRKRRPALLLAAAVLLLGFALPLILRYGFPNAGASLDRMWLSGPASSAHSRFLTDCSACHQQPFQPVRNETCSACHNVIKQHSDRPELLALPGLRDARCGACHLEHSGGAALRAGDPGLCTDCHARPEKRFAQTSLPPAASFSGNHPPFTPGLPRYEARRGFSTLNVSQDQSAEQHEESNLVFPHDVHLDPRGIRASQEKNEGRKVLDCGSCHAPAGRGESFRPARFQEHCASCHRLDFDPDEPERVLPHARPAEVARIIRDHYARRALAGEVKDPAEPEITRLRRVPGEALNTEQSRAAMQWAQERATQVVDEVFERRVCGGCHTIERTSEPDLPWRVAPVAQTTTYFTGARFDHAVHRTEDCALCHDAKSSNTSSQLMLPDLARCRDCHGDPGHSEQVPSACADCHSFHTARHTLMEPAP